MIDPEDKMVYAHVERQLIAIWAEVLEKSVYSVEDSFFDLGGDSLSAMLCIARMRTTFGKDFDIADFFIDRPTISYFAASICNE